MNTGLKWLHFRVVAFLNYRTVRTTAGLADLSLFVITNILTHPLQRQSWVTVCLIPFKESHAFACELCHEEAIMSYCVSCTMQK